MEHEIPVTEARAQFSELVNRVGFGKERIVLTRHGRPLVALVPAEMLEELDVGGSTLLDLASQATPSESGRLQIAAQDGYPPEAR